MVEQRAHGGTDVTIVTPQQVKKPEWQWGDYYPQSEDEQRRMFILDRSLPQVAWEEPADYYTALGYLEEWLKTGELPKAEGDKPKTRTVLKTV